MKINILLFVLCSNFLMAQEYQNQINLNQIHHIIKYNYPISNFDEFNWDALLIDNLSALEKNPKDPIHFFKEKYSMFGPDVFFSKDSLSMKASFNRPYFYYKHHGFGIEAEKSKLNTDKYYYTEILNTKNNNVEPYKTYRISNSLYLNVSLPTNLKKIKLKDSYRRDSKKGELYRNKYAREATVLAAVSTFNKFKISSSSEIDLSSFLKESDNSKNLDEFILLMNELHGKFNDSHCNYFYGYSQNPLIYRQKTYYYPKLATIFNNDSLYVAQVDSTLEKDFPVGTTILKVNEIASKEFFYQQLKYQSSSTNSFKLYKANENIFRSLKKDSVFKIEIYNKGISFLKSSNETPFNYKNNSYFISPNDSTLVIDLSHPDLNYQIFKENIDLIKKQKLILFILNVRPSFDASKILTHFSKDTLKSAEYKIEIQYSNSNFKEFEVESYTDLPSEFIDVKSAFIVFNPFSYGQTIMELVKHYKIGPIIGTNSAGSNGDIALVDYPLGIGVFTGLRSYRNGVFLDFIEPDYKEESINYLRIYQPEFINMIIKKYLSK